MSFLDFITPEYDSETDEPKPTKPERGPLPLDLAIDILNNRRRRHVIRIAEKANGTITTDDLAEVLADMENGGRHTSQERKRVYVSLYQTHLPKLDDAGVLVYVDDQEHEFERGAAFEQVYRMLSRVEPLAEEVSE